MPEPVANPSVVGSDVRDVAAMIEQQGLLEQSLTVDGEPPVEQAPEKAPATPEPEETPEGEPAPESEGTETVSPEEDESTTREAESESEEKLPDTLDGIAEAVGLSADEFAEHLNVPIKINGETRMVTLREAQKGYQLEVDYTRKTEDLAEQRRVLEAHQAQAVQAWQQRFASLDGLNEQLEKAVSEDTGNLDRILAEEGTEAFLMAKQKADRNKELAVHYKAEREKAALETQEAQRVQYEAYQQEQYGLLVQAIPEIAHAEKGPKLNASLRTEALERGYSEQELKRLVNHRDVLILRDAMRYRDLQKAKSSTVKKLKGLPKVVKPGVTPEKGDIARQRGAAALQRLKKSGTRNDAAKLIEGLL